MKRFLSTLLVAMLIVSSFAAVSFAAGTGSISGGHETAKIGEEVTVAVTVKGEFANFELFVDVEAPLSIVSFSNVGAANTATGKVVWATDENVTSHTFYVTLKVADNAKVGTYPVALRNKFVSDRNLEDLEIAVSNGSVKVVCDHVWGDWTVTEEATCAKEGTKARTCSICGETETEKIAKTEHTWGDWTVTEEPTCAKEGTKTRTCSVCGETETEKVAKTEHNWSDWTVTEEPTCTKEGTKTRTCSICGETETEKVAKTEHNWGDWTVTEEPTCTKEGTKTRTCSICGEKQTEKIAKAEHSWSEWKVEKPATCTEDGLKSRTCSVCGEKETEVIPSSEGHAWGEWTVIKEATCTENGERTRTCSACGEVETEVIEAAGHVWGTEWEMDETNHWHSCSVCGEKCEHSGEHIWGDWTVNKDATSNEDGEKSRSCSICNGVQTEKIPATGDPLDPPKTGDPTIGLMVGGLSLLLLLLLAALYYIKRKASAAE